MAGHQDEDGIRLHGLTHGPGRAGATGQQGDLAVADHLPWLRGHQHLGHPALEGREIREVQGDIPQLLRVAGEVGHEPPDGFQDPGRGADRLLALQALPEPQPADALGCPGQPEAAQGRGEGQRVGHDAAAAGAPFGGMKLMARSARAVMVRDGFTPGLAEMAEPSMT